MRDMTDEYRAASEDPNVRPVWLVDMDFASGHIYLNSTPNDLVFDGNTYLGRGDVGRISDIEESVDPQANAIEFTLTGIPSSYIAIALDEDYVGRSVWIYHGLLDANHQLIPNPIKVWKGRMDPMSVELGDTGTVTVPATNILAAWDKPKNLRYNDATQQALYPGDRCMEFVSQAETGEILWR